MNDEINTVMTRPHPMPLRYVQPMNGRCAISLRMSRQRVDGKKLERAAAGGIAEWWTDYALDWHRTHGGGESDAELGAKLARVAGRPAPW